jgi:hypothetical protein
MKLCSNFILMSTSDPYAFRAVSRPHGPSYPHPPCKRRVHPIPQDCIPENQADIRHLATVALDETHTVFLVPIDLPLFPSLLIQSTACDLSLFSSAHGPNKRSFQADAAGALFKPSGDAAGALCLCWVTAHWSSVQTVHKPKNILSKLRTFPSHFKPRIVRDWRLRRYRDDYVSFPFCAQRQRPSPFKLNFQSSPVHLEHCHYFAFLHFDQWKPSEGAGTTNQ